MGGKTQTATQQVQIPPEVMARYRAVNTRAETVAGQPFQPYSSDPNAFVAPLTPTQVAGMQNINQAAGMAQPYFNTAAGLTLGGAQGVGPLTQQQIGYYQNPYTQAVVGSTLAGLQQQQGQQLAQQQANAIRAGAFGGDRAGIERAQLMGQQNLAMAQAIAPLYQQGYQQAVQTAAGQQGVLAQDLQRQLAAGQQLGGLGAAGQQAALAGAQAQLGAGTAEQQTQQAGLQALYNQFLQERGYPFQVAQFLANIAMGTGALSGSTTTTTQPAPFFSDEDNKRNIRVLGKDPQTGLNVIAYDDADDLRKAREYGEPMPPKRVSYSAQEIERRAPGLVREVGGNKVVGMADGGAPPFALRAPVMGAAPGLGVAAQVAAPQAANVIPISRGAYRPNLAPKATGFSLGTPAASSDERGFGRFARLLEMMQGRNRGGYQSMGGLVSEPGNYATGGSIVGENDMKAILAAIGAPLEFYGGKGLYGGAAKGGAGSPGYVPQGQASIPKLVTAGGLPRMPESGLSQAAQTGSQIAELAKMGKSALVGSEGVGGKKGSTGAFGSEGELNKKGYISGLGGAEKAAPGEPVRLASAPPADVENVRDYALDLGQIGELVAARGGLMRHHYDLGGSTPYSSEDLGEDPLKDVVKEGSGQKYQLATPGKPPAPTPGLGSELMGAAKLAKTGSELYGMLPAGVTEGLGSAASGLGSALSGAGAAAAEGIGALGSGLAAGGAELLALLPALFSDERMKDNVERVGELYDGQPIYRYNMKGSNKTQIGLMAQDVERNGHRDAVAGLGGLKMVDYKRATDVAAGLAPREGMYRGGYQDGGLTEEDLPLVLAALQEPAREAERPAGIVPRISMSDAEPAERPIIREPGLVVAERTLDQPGATPVRSDERPAGVVPPTVPARAEPTGVAPRGVGTETGAPPRLLGRESGGNFSAQNEDTGASGRAQFIESRFEDAKRAGAVPADMTFEQFRKTPAAQISAERWHFADVNNFIGRNDLGRYVGTTIAGIPVTRDGLVNVAHLGGNEGLRRFLESGGRYNPADANGTRLTDYLAMGAGVSGGQRPIGGVVPPEQIASRSPYATLFGGMFGNDMKPETKQALTSENLWVPALAGLGSMLSSRSPYLASAIGEGLVGGTRAYTDLQKQQSEIDRERAQTALTGIQAASQSIKYGADGRPQAVLVSDGRGGTRWVPFYEVINNPNAFNLSPATRAEMEEAARRAGIRVPSPTTGAAAGATPAGATPPAAPAGTEAGAEGNVIRAGAIEIPRQGEYSVSITPARGGVSDNYMREAIQSVAPGVNVSNPNAIRSVIDMVPQLAEKATTDQRVATQILDRARQLDRNITDIWQLASSVNKISDDKFTAEGAGQEYRAALANLYNTAARLAGAPGAQIDVGSDVDSAQIIRKLQALSSPQMAQQSGFHASSIANAISSAMPSGNMTKEAANTIISTMLVDLQRDRDFNRYYDAYVRRYGTALNVYQNFNAEMGDRYDIEKQRLKQAMTGHDIEERDQSGRVVTRRESAIDVLRRDPNAARRFDQRYETPGLARYWRTN